MEGNLQLLYVLLTDCYVYLLRKGACRSRPEWVGLNSSPPSPYPHFKHILMTSGRKFCCSFTLLGTERAGS